MAINHSESEMLERLDAMRKQAAKRDADAAAARIAAADENRRRMPVLSAFIDKAKAALGDDLKVTYASENGVTLGKEDKSEGVKLSETTVGHYVRAKK
ncbi:MAG: hypothetical protein ACKO0Z_16320 [Betaproteobacteria bacterium]